MSHDPYAYAPDELGKPAPKRATGIITTLGLMLMIAVLSALVLMEPPMAPSVEISDEDRVANLLAIPPSRATAPLGDSSANAPEQPAADPAPVLREVSFTAPVTTAAPVTPALPEQKKPEPPRPDPSSITETARVSAAAPTAPAPAPAPPSLTQGPTGRYLIQIGSMSSEAAANGEISRMRRMAPALFAGVETELEYTRLDDGRSVYRMRIAGIAAKSEARAWCVAFKARGGACYVIG
ncbi:MAG: SPOR domain-containing protein [Pseudomonadota bacterium]